MLCIKTIVLFFLLNGLEMPSSAKVIYKGMTRVEFPEIFEPIKKVDHTQDIDENDGMPRIEFPEIFEPIYRVSHTQDIEGNDGMPRVEFPEIFEPIKKMHQPLGINKNEEMTREGKEPTGKEPTRWPILIDEGF